jgi:hypothetical protein
VNAREKFYQNIARRNARYERSSGESISGLDGRTFYFPESMWKRKELPWIYFDPILPGKPHNQNRAGIFGLPGKMGCLAFSLPAGPTGSKYCGTCPASGYNISDPTFICNACYALIGNYQTKPAPIRRQQIARVYAEIAVADGVFARQMITALRYAYNLPAKNRRTTVKDKKTGVKRTVDYSTTRYFRIHDSGDFFNIKYFEAWCEIAEAFRRSKWKTRFWAPTRVILGRDNKPIKKWHDAMKQAPDNLIVRPSSLYFLQMPPDVPGLAAGSTAVIEHPTNPSIPGEIDGVKMCPAYRLKAGFRTCRDVGCRTCWNEPDVRISYPAHGSDANHILEAFGGAVKHNPAVAGNDYLEPDLLAEEDY